MLPTTSSNALCILVSWGVTSRTSRGSAHYIPQVLVTVLNINGIL